MKHMALSDAMDDRPNDANGVKADIARNFIQGKIIIVALRDATG